MRSGGGIGRAVGAVHRLQEVMGEGQRGVGLGRAFDLREHQLQYAAQMEPDAFTRWVFPRLFHSRIPRYEAIARPYGYTVSSSQVNQIRDEGDFLEMVELTIAAG